MATEYLQDLAVTRRFPKPTKIYENLNLYGANIVSTSGDLWKKYRKLSNSSFSEVSQPIVSSLIQYRMTVLEKQRASVGRDSAYRGRSD